MKSSLLLSNFTCLDHAVLTTQGICGGSYMVSIEVSGEVTSDEHVVVDFGTIKKDIKAIIDDNEYGMDHKLWVTRQDVDNTAITSLDSYYVFTTPELSVTLPRNAFHILRDADSLENSVKLYVQEKLDEKYPGVLVDKVILSTEPVLSYNPGFKSGTHFVSKPALFRYVHGLKDSTSWGCQNIAHGHLSYVQLVATVPNGVYAAHTAQLVENLALEIAESINDFHFINEANCYIVGYDIPSSTDYTFVNSYHSLERGNFDMRLRGISKMCILPTETTIEYIVEHVASVFEDRLREAGVARIIVSEGLTKAAFKDVA